MTGDPSEPHPKHSDIHQSHTKGGDTQGDGEGKPSPQKHCHSCERYCQIACRALKKICGLWPNAQQTIAIFTVVLAASTIGLWMEGSRTTKVLINGQRAWLAPSGFKLIDPVESATDPLAVFVYGNGGKEPATKVSQDVQTTTILRSEYLKVGAIETAISAAEQGRDCKSVPLNNAGGAAFPSNGAAYALQFRFRKSDIGADVLNRDRFLVVVACLKYETFGEPHYSSYCGILDSTDLTKPKELWNAAFCHDGIGNEAN